MCGLRIHKELDSGKVRDVLKQDCCLFDCHHLSLVDRGLVRESHLVRCDADVIADNEHPSPHLVIHLAAVCVDVEVEFLLAVIHVHKAGGVKDKVESGSHDAAVIHFLAIAVDPKILHNPVPVSETADGECSWRRVGCVASMQKGLLS